MRSLIVLLPLLFSFQDTGYDSSVKFSMAPSEEEKQAVERIILGRLEMLGVEKADFSWDGSSLSYTTDPYKDPGLLSRYVNIRGRISFSAIEEVGEEEDLRAINNGVCDVVATEKLDIEIVSMESLDYHEPNYKEITLKLNKPVKNQLIMCLVDDMKVAVCEIKSEDSAVAVVKNPYEKLLKICLESGPLPVEVISNLSRIDYESAKDVWFPISSDLRRKLYKKRSRFELEQLDHFPRLSDYINPERKCVIRFSKGNGSLVLLKLPGRSVRAVVVKGLVNMDSGFIEVAISNGGKLHESLLFTPVDMRSLDLAVTAAGFEKEGKKASGNVYVQWEDNDKLYTYKLEDLIIDINSFRTMKRAPWKYQYNTMKWHNPITDEHYDIPKFIHSGLVITTLRNDSSLFDNPSPNEEAMDDSRYVVNSFLVPSAGQKVFIIFVLPEKNDK